MKKQNYFGLMILLVSLQLTVFGGGPAVRITSGCYFYTGSKIIVNSDLKNDGTFSASQTSGIIFSGNMLQTIGGTGTTQFQDAVFNNPADFELAGSITVNGNLSLTDGIITTGTNTLSLLVNSTAGRTNGYVNGNLSKAYSTAQSFIYHLGTANGYSPMALTFNSLGSGGTVTATAIQSVEPNVPDQTNVMSRYWTLTPGGGLTGSYNATFTYLPADFVSDLTETSFESTGLWAEYNSSAWSFPTIGTWTKGSGDDGGSIQVTGLTAFGDFTGIGCSGEQPVITQQTDGGTQCVGGAKTFSLTVSSQLSAPAYQWVKDGNAIDSATSSTYQLSTTGDSDMGNYSCIVTNICGNVTSNTYSLTKCCYTVH